jgi:hypothetical protein
MSSNSTAALLIMPTIHVQHDGHAGILSGMSSRSATVAGADASLAVVEPEAGAALTAFDAHVTHYGLVVQAGS